VKVLEQKIVSSFSTANLSHHILLAQHRQWQTERRKKYSTPTQCVADVICCALALRVRHHEAAARVLYVSHWEWLGVASLPRLQYRVKLFN
jgi:hypothetical protein